MTCRQKINRSTSQTPGKTNLVRLSRRQEATEKETEEGGNFVETKWDDDPPKGARSW